MPVAQSGGVSDYQAAIINYRVNQAEQVLTQTNGPMATIFDQEVVGQVSLDNSLVLSDTTTPLTVVEWVVQAGKRLWIVRATQEDPQGTTDFTSSADFLQSLNSLVIGSSGIDNLTTLTVDSPPITEPTPPPDSPDNIPFPYWWSGYCNVNHHPGSFGLGATFQGLIACGPRGQEVLVNFHAGWPNVLQKEWQCTELSKRWLYLRYGTNPYLADGNQMVSNYSTAYGGGLAKYYNQAIPGRYPRVGDVLALGTSRPGHTSVVTSVTIDWNGNGSLMVIQQNSTANGWGGPISIRNWYVVSSVTGWLHKP